MYVFQSDSKIKGKVGIVGCYAGCIAFWKLLLGDPKFKTSLGYIESSKITQAAKIVRAVT